MIMRLAVPWRSDSQCTLWFYLPRNFRRTSCNRGFCWVRVHEWFSREDRGWWWITLRMKHRQIHHVESFEGQHRGLGRNLSTKFPWSKVSEFWQHFRSVACLQDIFPLPCHTPSQLIQLAQQSQFSSHLVSGAHRNRFQRGFSQKCRYTFQWDWTLLRFGRAKNAWEQCLLAPEWNGLFFQHCRHNGQFFCWCLTSETGQSDTHWRRGTGFHRIQQLWPIWHSPQTPF